MNGWGWFFLLLFLILLAYAGWAGWHFYSAKRQGLPPPTLKSYIPFIGMRAGGSGSGSNNNYPSPRASGPLDWIKDQVAKLRNSRSHRGAYEEATGGIGGGGAGGAAEQGYGNIGGGGGATTRGNVGGGVGGRSPGGARGLEDDAWDTRVGNDDADVYGYGGPVGASGPGGYYEEQELGLAPTPGYVPHHQSQHQQQQQYQGYSGGGGDYLSQPTGYAGGMSNERGRQLTTHTADNPFDDSNEAASMRGVSPRPVIDTKGKGHARDPSSLDSTHSSPTSIRKSHFREGDMR